MTPLDWLILVLATILAALVLLPALGRWLRKETDY